MTAPAYVSDPALLSQLNAPAGGAPGPGYVSDPALLAQLNGGADPAPSPEAPGVVESAALGAAQGLTFGFGDELYGAANFLLSGGKQGSYSEARDRARGRIHAAEEAHPIVSTAANIAGGLLVPGGIVKSGATVAGKAAAGAALGGLGALGGSEGRDVGEVVADTAKGAAVGGVLFPLVSAVAGKVIEGAPERSVRRIVGDITDGATATQRDRLVGKIAEKAESGVAKVGDEVLPTTGRKGVDAVLDLMSREPVLKKSLRAAADEPEKALRAVQETISSKGQRLGEIYGDLDRVALGVPVKDVTGALAKVAEQYSNPAEKAIRKQIESLADDIVEQWGSGKEGLTAYVPLRQLRDTITSVQARGFSGGIATPPSITKQMQQATAGALKDVLDSRFEQIAHTAERFKGVPGLAEAGEIAAGATPTPAQLAKRFIDGAGGVGEIRQLNKDYSTLRNLEDVLAYRAQRAASPSTTLRARGDNLLDIGLVATGNLPAFAAKKAYQLVGKQIVKFGDDKLAQLVMKARAGLPEAKIAQQAMELGLGNAALAPLLAQWAYRTAQQSGMGGQEAAPL